MSGGTFKLMNLNLSPAIRIRIAQSVDGQPTTDPTAGDDANAIQDAVGNDAAGLQPNRRKTYRRH